MLLVILGAGASYDSAPDHPPGGGKAIGDRPPLANELFEARPEFLPDLDEYPECRPIVPRLRPSADRPIETELERIQEEGKDNPVRHRQLAAVRFYIRRMLTRCTDSWHHTHARGVTNYLALVDAIRQHPTTALPVCFVTFNYDRLLERALPEVGVEIRDLPDYITNPHYKVIKLHGSVDWAHEIETDIVAVRDRSGARESRVVREIINRAPELVIRPGHRRANGLPVAAGPEGPALFPALAIPVVAKQQFECPDTHVTALREFLPRVRKVLIVGWRGTEAPFLDLLRAGMTNAAMALAACGSPSSGTETLERLIMAKVPLEPREAVPRGFTQFMYHDAGRFLAAEP